MDQRNARYREAELDQVCPLALALIVNSFAQMQNQRRHRTGLEAGGPLGNVGRLGPGDLRHLRVDLVAVDAAGPLGVVQIAHPTADARAARSALQRRGSSNQLAQFRPFHHFATGLGERRLLGLLERMVAVVRLPRVARLEQLPRVFPARQVVVVGVGVRVDHARRHDAVGTDDRRLDRVRRARAIRAYAHDFLGQRVGEDLAVRDQLGPRPDRASNA